jgi:hypothetical protein
MSDRHYREEKRNREREERERALVYAEAFLGWLFKESASAEASTSPRSREGPPLSIGGSSPNQRPFSLNFGGGRNIDLLAIVYALRPRLRIRLTLGGRTGVSATAPWDPRVPVHSLPATLRMTGLSPIRSYS